MQPLPPKAGPQKPRWIASVAIAVIVATIGGVWLWHEKEDSPAPGYGRQADDGNWLTKLWGGDAAPDDMRRPGERQLPPLPQGPVAPDLRLVATFPDPDDPSQAFAGIAPKEEGAEAKLYKTGDLVVGEYTIEEIKQRYVSLDKKGKTFYLYKEQRESTRQRSPEREARRKQRQERRALMLEMRQKRQAERAAAGKDGPTRLPDGTTYVPVLGGPDRIEDGRGNTIGSTDAESDGAETATP